MSYQVLARKWRPQNFAELVGQEKVLTALVHGLNEGRLHHAYLFTGTRGVGKTTVARILAKCFNCEQGISATPCGTCETCVEIRDGRFVDLIEIDAASRTKVEDTRDLLDNIQYAPAKGRFKVYIIDEVHMLSTHSFNALLKTLEEPPEHVKFLLATTDPQKLPITVLSRCLQFHLKNIPAELIVQHLQTVLEKENITFEHEALSAIAKAAEGSLRDALSLTDQAIGQGEGQVQTNTTLHMLGVVRIELLYQLAECIAIQNKELLSQLFNTINDELVDYPSLLNLLAELWYEISLMQILPNFQSIEWDNTVLQKLAKSISPTLIQLFYDMTIQGKKILPFAPEARIGFNMTIMRMMAFQPMQSTEGAVIPTQSGTQKSEASALDSRLRGDDKSAPAISVEKIALEQWDTLLNTLPLAGMTKQMFKNTSFERQEGHTIWIKTTKENLNLLNDTSKNKLIHALQTYYEKQFSLQIISSDTPIETPALKEKEAREASDLQLQEKLNKDPNIDFIKNNFNGKISSIQLNNQQE